MKTESITESPSTASLEKIKARFDSSISTTSRLMGTSLTAHPSNQQPKAQIIKIMMSTANKSLG